MKTDVIICGDNVGVLRSFPERLAHDHILSWSDPGAIVLDPFVGSGTTTKQAQELGRQWIGIDISPKYCNLARRRMAAAKTPLFVESPNE
jgi:DNA modification methylase